MRRGRLLLALGIGLIVVIMLIATQWLEAATPLAAAGTSLGDQTTQGSGVGPFVCVFGPCAPHPPCPGGTWAYNACTIKTNWVGLGVESPSAADPITAINGSWNGFSESSSADTITCPTAGEYSEAIGAGLNTKAGTFGGKIDGVGTVVSCDAGSLTYYAWFEEGGAPQMIQSFPIGPDHLYDTIQVGVTLSGWNIWDVTTGQIAVGAWTTPLASTNRQAECIVGRGGGAMAKSLLGPSLLSKQYKPLLPGSSSETLTQQVYFGTAYTASRGATTGCWVYSPVHPNTKDPGWFGIGSVPAGWAPDFFQLKNPPPAGALIWTQGYLSGPLDASLSLSEDSFFAN